MTAASDYLSAHEVRRTLMRLRPADVVRLTSLAKVWSRKVRRNVHEDLLNEAFTRVLAGDRKWPADLAIGPFFSQVMRSIADQWRIREVREPQLLGDDPPGAGEVGDGGRHEGEMAVRHLRDRIRRDLVDDPIALRIFELSMADASPADIQAALDIDATQYDTARRRMKRRLFLAYPDGYPL